MNIVCKSFESKSYTQSRKRGGQTALSKTFIDFFDSIVFAGSKFRPKTLAKWFGLKASMCTSTNANDSIRQSTFILLQSDRNYFVNFLQEF